VSAPTVPGPPTPTPHRSWAFLARPGWIAGVLGAVLFTIACWAILAPWQFRRHEERDLANTQIEAAAGATPRDVTALLTVGAPPPTGSTWQPVTATGTFDVAHQVYVRLRQDNNGQPASEIVVPLILDDGSAVLVDRGYLALGDVGSALPALPAGRVTVTGRVQPDQPDPLHRPAQVTDGRTEVLGISALDVPGFSGPVRHGFIQLTEDSPGVLRAIGVPQTDDGPFLSYALQWCAFGGMALIAIAVFVVREYRDPRSDDDDESDPTESVAAPAISEDSGSRKDRRGFDRSQLYDPR
jgi:cytochrome oxidase assembly protein ShyY1